MIFQAKTQAEMFLLNPPQESCKNKYPKATFFTWVSPNSPRTEYHRGCWCKTAKRDDTGIVSGKVTCPAAPTPAQTPAPNPAPAPSNCKAKNEKCDYANGVNGHGCCPNLSCRTTCLAAGFMGVVCDYKCE